MASQTSPHRRRVLVTEVPGPRSGRDIQSSGGARRHSRAGSGIAGPRSLVSGGGPGQVLHEPVRIQVVFQFDSGVEAQNQRARLRTATRPSRR